MHLAMAGGFADRSAEQWFLHHPMFAHGGLHYPFVVNFLSGMLQRVGLGLDFAMTLPTLIAGLATPFLLYLVFYQLMCRCWPAVVAVCIFFLGSGLGGFSYLAEVFTASDWSGLIYPAREVSRLDEYDWYSGNFLTGMLLPQRAFVLGFPLALVSLSLLLHSLSAPRAVGFAVAGGIVAGLLPIVHVHSYMALAGVGIAVALTHPRAWRHWVSFAIPAAVLGLTLASAFLLSGNDQHLRWAPGFSADGGWADWALMWWRLWGLAIPLAVVALPLLLRAPNRLRAAVLAGAMLFVFANLVLVQPNRWDNSKIFLWVYFCWTPLWAYGLAVLWSRRWQIKLLVPVVLIVLCLTGLVELLRLANVNKGEYMIASSSDLFLAEQIRRETDPGAVFATETSHNHVIMAFGARPIMLGFTGWMANLGFDHGERERDLEAIYAGGNQAEQLINQYGVDYVAIGAGERRRFKNLNEAWYRANFPLRFENGNYQIYQTLATPQQGL